VSEKTKTIKWNLNDPIERQVWEWMRTLPHGTFSEETKAYWFKRYEERNKIQESVKK
jgi:hypothetical protein